MTIMKKYLLTPGPTPVPPRVLVKMAEPILHHRTPQFMAILKEALEGLKYVFQTANDIFVFASSGTGAMEAAVVNLLSAGDAAAVVCGGKFGERFSEICKAYGVNPVELPVTYGQAADPARIKQLLDERRDIKVVYTTLTETSTGTVNDIKEIAAIVARTDAVLVVDAISGLGADEIRTDEWGVDVVVSGSQKGLMLPPGLAFCSVSKKAWKLVESAKLPRYYFNLKKAKKALDKTDTPFTPAVSLIIGLTESLRMIREEGMDTLLARHRVLAEATRAGVKALGMELFSARPSNAVTAVTVPAGVDGEKLVRTMRDTYGVTIAGGQDSMKGTLFRIAHMGFMDRFDCVLGLSCLETVLTAQAYAFTPGASVAAAQKVLQPYT